MVRRHIIIAAIFAVVCLPALVWGIMVNPVPSFYNRGGVIAYEPVVDVVTTGTQVLVRPTVSADRKYVTLSMTPQISQLVRLQTFSVAGGTTTGGGIVGGGAPAPAMQGSTETDVNISSPVRINTGRGGAVLNQVGMTRIDQ